MTNMLTPEQIAYLTKMYEDIQVLKTEVISLRSYKEDSTTAIKTLMAEKDKLAAEVKTLKEARAPTLGSFAGNQLAVPAQFTDNQPSVPSLFAAPLSSAAPAFKPLTGVGTAQPNGFSFPSTSTPNIFGGMAGAAGKPSQATTISTAMWGSRPMTTNK